VGDGPGKYWDHNECRWVRYASPESVGVDVPAQAEPVDGEWSANATDTPDLGSGQGIDVRSG
jgi:hypothetical protein